LYFTSDWAAAGASVRKLAALGAEAVAPGHGKPMAGANVAEALRKLAARFREVAVPENVKHEAA
jgi:glyoxylase-like metal-dependent hydrolase (beta-lactamase superfamily II)